MKKKIQAIVLKSIKSEVDMHYVKEKINKEHTDEISRFDFSKFNYVDLPWDSMIFEILDIKKGSSILDFSIEFKEPPITDDDLNARDLITLVVVTIIENLEFIEKVKDFESKKIGDELILKARTKAKFFDRDLQQKTMDYIRSILKFISGEKVQGIDQSNADVNKFLEKILKRKRKDVERLMTDFSPRSMRDIAKTIKNSNITEKDVARIHFNFEPDSAKKNQCEVIKPSEWLFPFDHRRLADLDPQKFEEIINLTKGTLPVDLGLWKQGFLHNLDVYGESEDLQDLRSNLANSIHCGAYQDWPYAEILKDYKKQGGTVGGLLKALGKFKDEASTEEAKASISEYATSIEELREDMYTRILDNVFCPSQSPSIKNFQDFQDLARNKGMRVGDSNMETFEGIQESLIPGDQLWLYRRPIYMYDYAHVVIITEKNKFVHVSASNMVWMQGKAIIKEEEQNQLKKNKFCFIVRKDNSTDETDKLCKRAKICTNPQIRFDYDPVQAHCETFCNGVHGKWIPNVQSAQGGGQTVLKGVVKFAQLFWRSDEPLIKQMETKFKKEDICFHNECFYTSLFLKC